MLKVLESNSKQQNVSGVSTVKIPINNSKASINFLFLKDYVVCNKVILGQSRRTPFIGRQRKIVSNIT